MMRDHFKNAVILIAAVACGWAAGHFGVSEFVMGSADSRKSRISAESCAPGETSQDPLMCSAGGAGRRNIREAKVGPYRSRAARVVSVGPDGQYVTE